MLINECDEESLDSLIIGGNYEILDQDDEVIQTISCTNAECLSDFLPVGNYKIRVKDLPDDYEENNTNTFNNINKFFRIIIINFIKIKLITV